MRRLKRGRFIMQACGPFMYIRRAKMRVPRPPVCRKHPFRLTTSFALREPRPLQLGFIERRRSRLPLSRSMMPLLTSEAACAICSALMHASDATGLRQPANPKCS